MSGEQHAPGAHQAGNEHNPGVSAPSAPEDWRKREEVALAVREKSKRRARVLESLRYTVSARLAWATW